METRTEMTLVRIALANRRFPRDAEDALARTLRAITDAAAMGAQIICFPECFPGIARPRRTSRRPTTPSSSARL
jgi:predicted amidohydrolase